MSSVGDFANTRDKMGKNRLTIGYVTSGIHDPVGNLLWQGVVDAARRYDLNLVCVTGGRLHDDGEFFSQGNILYELLGAEHVDGVVLWALSLYEVIEPAQVIDFHRRYDPRPIVTLGQSIGDHPMIGVDNMPGIRELMEHLVSDHHCRRIAFLRGPDNHPYAQERYQVYCQVLSDHHIPFDPLLVSQPGRWGHRTAVQAVRLLFDERRLRPGVDVEAIVAVNEDFALVAIQALQERGVHIPRQVAVVGIHSTQLGQCSKPPLTSVVVPTYERGYSAVETLVKRLQGRAVPAKLELPTWMIVRQSCGCLDPLVSRAKASSSPLRAGQSTATAFEDRDDAIITALTHSGPHELGLERAQAVQVLQALSSDVRGATEGAFLTALEDRLGQVTANGERVSAWQTVVSILRQAMLTRVNPEDERERLENLMNQARVLIGETARLAEAYQLLQTEEQARLLRELSHALMTTFDIPNLVDLLVNHLPRLEISACYLAVYESPQPYRYPQPAPEWSRLLLAYDAGKRLPLEEGGRRFPTRQIVPEGLWPAGRRYQLAIEPLHFREEQIGFVLFEIGPRDGMLYDGLRREISSALQGALLVQRVRQRTVQLEAINQELEAFSSSVSHDLRAPLRAIDGFARILMDDYAPQLPPDLVHYLQVIRDNVAKMRDLIDALLNLSRLSRQAFVVQTVDMGAVLREALKDLAHEQAGRHIEIAIGALPSCIGDPTLLKQVWINLLSNAIKFTRNRPTAHIEIGCLRSQDDVPGHSVYFVRDDGAGFDMRHAQRLFGIFQRLHRTQDFEGTGVGLATVQRIISRHGGRIWADAKPDAGATFYFTLGQ